MSLSKHDVLTVKLCVGFHPGMQDVDGPAIIPHIAESSNQKFPYEVLFRSLHKLLMDTATSE